MQHGNSLPVYASKISEEPRALCTGESGEVIKAQLGDPMAHRLVN